MVILDDALPVISISEIAPVNESAGRFTVTLTSNIQPIAGYDLVIDTLTVTDTTSEDPAYDPQVQSEPIVITSASQNNAVNATITITKDSAYHAWETLNVALSDGDEYTADSRTQKVVM